VTHDEIADVMNLLHEVRWDRCINAPAGKPDDISFLTYGWIDRADGRADFVLLEFNDVGAGITTSSAQHSRAFSERLYGASSNHQDCLRVEDVFGDLVERKVVLA
jgi:hypothetical protein